MNISNKIGSVINHLLFVIFLGCGLYSTWLLFAEKMFVATIALVFFGGLTGIMFTKLYLGNICYNFVRGIIYPHVCLKAAPPVLSSIQGLISSGRYEQAEEELTKLIEQHPGNTLVLQTLIELYRNMLGKEQEIYSYLFHYFTCSQRAGYNVENIHLLLMLAEYAVTLERSSAVKPVLQAELRKKYPPAEKQLIAQRLEAWN